MALGHSSLFDPVAADVSPLKLNKWGERPRDSMCHANLSCRGPARLPVGKDRAFPQAALKRTDTTALWFYAHS
jgi:hypothetical protein